MSFFSKYRIFLYLTVFIISVADIAVAQKAKPVVKTKPIVASVYQAGGIGIIVDERLSVLRDEPSFFAIPIQRMRLGRLVKILAIKQNEGVTFLKVTGIPSNYGWIQSDAIVSKTKTGDDEKLAKLVQAIDGFEQIELASSFLDIFTKSALRPAILLLYGDLIEEQARKLSTDAGKRLIRREMAATIAPLHSFYLNYVGLDRFRKLGITFLFNVETKQFHYNGKSWDELIKKYPAAEEAVEAKKRIESLKEKLESPGKKK
jgi:hypothetical protein